MNVVNDLLFAKPLPTLLAQSFHVTARSLTMRLNVVDDAELNSLITPRSVAVFPSTKNAADADENLARVSQPLKR